MVPQVSAREPDHPALAVIAHQLIINLEHAMNQTNTRIKSVAACDVLCASPRDPHLRICVLATGGGKLRGRVSLRAHLSALRGIANLDI